MGTRVARNAAIDPTSPGVSAPVVRNRTSLEDVFDARSNSIGFLRFVLASMVLVGHSYLFGGFGDEIMWDWTKGQENYGGLAVGGFFVLSGFLITRSYTTTTSVFRFLWQRFLRIFPGFWACLIVTAFVIGPLIWRTNHGGFSGYTDIADESPFDFVTRNAKLTMRQYGIGDLLANAAVPRNLNGSLWTLIYELRCYVAVAVFGVFGLLKRGRGVVLGVTAMLWVIQIVNIAIPNGGATISPLLGDLYLIRLSFLFGLGACLYLYRDRVPMDDRAGVFAAVLLLLSFRYHLFFVVGQAALAYVLLWAGWRLPFKWFDRYGDFSYGLYLYAFPVQQLLAIYPQAAKHGHLWYVLVTFMVVVPMAVASYYLVERPFLRLKGASLPAPLLALPGQALSAAQQRLRQPGRARVEAPERALLDEDLDVEPVPAAKPEPVSLKQ